MLIRRFHRNGQSHSRNMTSYPGRCNHPARPVVHRPSQDEVAYASYVALCVGVGATPASFEDWYLRNEKINPADVSQHKAFHRHDLYGKQAPIVDKFHYTDREEWDGSWDNAIRALEG